MDGRSNQSDQGATVPAAMASEPPSAAALPQSSRNEQLSKEAEVGITEFVSPDLPGFSGILKKRYVSTVSLILIRALTNHIADTQTFWSTKSFHLVR